MKRFKKQEPPYNLKEPHLFTIPNPFDDYYRDKKGWYLEVQKLESVIKSLKERMNLLAQKHQERRAVTLAMVDYSRSIQNRNLRKQMSHNTPY
jgi:hypothetical protein